jgi:antitoxin MazE
MTKPQKIVKWGSGLAVRIPRQAAKRAGFREGDNITISVVGGVLTVRRIKPGYRIEDFLSRITPENQPEIVDWGPPVGKEAW